MVECYAIIILLLTSSVDGIQRRDWLQREHHGGSGQEHNNDKPDSVESEGQKYFLTIENDSPVILGANVTFFAKISLDRSNHGYREDDPQFSYWWRDDTGTYAVYTGGLQTNFSRKYEKSSVLGKTHDMRVQVREKSFIDMSGQVLNGKSPFTITEYINGDMKLIQPNSTLHKKWTYATNNSIEYIVNIYDPSHYFDDASMLFSWEFGDNNTKVTEEPRVSHTYSKPAFYPVVVVITADLPATKHSIWETIKTGKFSQTINLLDSVYNVSILGVHNTIVNHQNNYTVLCNGSLPINLCWYFSTDNCEISVNESEPVICQKITEKCEFHLVNHYNSTGSHCLRVLATNDVSSNITALFEVSVKEEPKPPDPAVTASVSTFAGLTTVGAIVVVLFASYQVVRARRMRHVEVADFDFMGSISNKRSPSTSPVSSSSSSSSSSSPSWFPFWAKKKERSPLINEYKTTAAKYESFLEIL